MANDGPSCDQLATFGSVNNVKRLPLPAQLAVLTVVMALPFALLTFFVWPGAFGAAFFGVLTGCLAWLNVGWKRAMVIGAVFAVLTIPANLLHAWPVAAAAAMLALIVAFGAAAVRGLASAVLPIAFLIPYYMMAPPPIFSADPPTMSVPYVLACAGLVLLGAWWPVYLFHMALPTRTGRPRPEVDAGLAWSYAIILAVFSAAVVYVGMRYFPDTHWAWVTLTLFILANPNTPMNLRKMRDRVLGTIGGFVLVSIVLEITTNRVVMGIVAMVCMYLALYVTGTGKPYWLYCIFLTPAIVSIDSMNGNPWIMANERVEFTVLGAVLAIIVSFAAAMILRSRTAFGKAAGVSSGTSAAGGDSYQDASSADVSQGQFDSHLR